MNGGQVQLPKTTTSGRDGRWKSSRRRVSRSSRHTTSASCAGPPDVTVLYVSSRALRSTLRTYDHVNNVSCVHARHTTTFTHLCLHLQNPTSLYPPILHWPFSVEFGIGLHAGYYDPSQHRGMQAAMTPNYILPHANFRFLLHIKLVIYGQTDIMLVAQARHALSLL